MTNMSKSTIIKPDGTTITREWPGNSGPCLEWMQKAVEGYIECLTRTSTKIVFVNEEGRLRRLPTQNYMSMTVFGNVLVMEGEPFVTDEYEPVAGDLDLGEILSEAG